MGQTQKQAGTEQSLVSGGVDAASMPPDTRLCSVPAAVALDVHTFCRRWSSELVAGAAFRTAGGTLAAASLGDLVQL